MGIPNNYVFHQTWAEKSNGYFDIKPPTYSAKLRDFVCLSSVYQYNSSQIVKWAFLNKRSMCFFLVFNRFSPITMDFHTGKVCNMKRGNQTSHRERVYVIAASVTITAKQKKRESERRASRVTSLQKFSRNCALSGLGYGFACKTAKRTCIEARKITRLPIALSAGNLADSSWHEGKREGGGRDKSRR